MFLISVIPTNTQIKKIMSTTSVGGFPVKNSTGENIFMYFKNEYGEEADLTIPEGGELTLDPSNPIDAYNIDVFKKRLSTYPESAGRYKVTDLTQEKVGKAETRKKKVKALNLVSELANEDFDTSLALARRLGLRKLDVTRTEVFDYLEEIADSDPEVLLSALNDPEKEMRLLLEKAIERKIMSRTREGQIKYGDIEGGQPIGKDENEAIIYLKQNPSLLDQIMGEAQDRPLRRVEARPAQTQEVEKKPESKEEVEKEVAEWLKMGLFTEEKTESGKTKQIMYTMMKLGKNTGEAAEYLIKNPHLLTILRQRTAK